MRITLNYWRPQNGGGTERERVYVNGDGDALGFFEQVTQCRDRNPNSASYYERHRWCKGEEVAYEPERLTWSGPEDLREKVLDAVFIQQPLIGKRSWRELWDRDCMGLWLALRDRASGFRYVVSGKRSRNKAVRDRAHEIERENAERQSLVFEV